MADYTDLIQAAARQYNIDPALLQAVIRTESSGNPNAKGPPTKYGTAQGIAQLLPQTAAALGVKNPNDPAEAIPAMAKLLDQNLTRYGNVEDALHAYHGGTDQANWGPKTQAYAQTVLSRVNQPKNLPGIPSGAGNSAQSDEDIFAAMSGIPKQSAAQPSAQSDDAIFQAMTRQENKVAPQQTAAPIAAPAGQPASGFLGSLQSAGAGAGKAFGEGMLGLQSLAGRGIRAVGNMIGPDQTPSGLVTGQKPQGALAQAGQWLINDAAQGRAKLEAENAPYMAAAPIANVGGQIVGTIAPGAAVAKGLGGVGNIAARTIGVESAAAPLIQAISTGGASSGKLAGLAGLATRAAGGAITGAGMGAVYSPDNIGTSAAIGGAVPVIGAGFGAAGRAISNAIGSNVSPAIGALVQTAKNYGIDIRPDQILNSKPIAALSGALDYLPFSGKGAATNAQQQQFKTAVARTIGENTPDLTQAINSAKTRLGAQFDTALKGTTLKADNALVSDLTNMVNNARNEMTDQQFGVITRQVDNLLGKVQPGDVVASDAAYNIKKGLDRMAKSNDSTLAYYARDMRDSLLGALSRSMPDGGAAFAKTRQQWSNLMQLQNLVKPGAEGEISAARLANARGIKTPELQDLQNIAAQFLKPKIGDSGTAQRLGALGTVSGAGPMFMANPVGTTGAVLGGIAGGRATNAVLGSPALGQAIANRAVNRGLQSAAGAGAPMLQVGPGLQALMQPGTVGSLMQLSRQPVVVEGSR
jgi:hypothetical protein